MARKIEKKEGVPCGQLVFTALAITIILIVSMLLALYLANQIHLISNTFDLKEVLWQNTNSMFF